MCRLCEFRANLCVHTVGIVSSCEFRFVGARSFCALMYTSNSYSFMFLLMYFDLLFFLSIRRFVSMSLCFADGNFKIFVEWMTFGEYEHSVAKVVVMRTRPPWCGEKEL